MYNLVPFVLLAILALTTEVWAQQQPEAAASEAPKESTAPLTAPAETAPAPVPAAANAPEPERAPPAPNSNSGTGTPTEPVTLPDVEIIQQQTPEDTAVTPSKPKVSAPEVKTSEPKPAQSAPPKVAKPKKRTAASVPKTKPKANPKPVVEPPQELEGVPVSDLADVPGTVIDAEVTPMRPLQITTSDEIAAKQGQTLADTLATKPGVNASTFAPGASRPIIRGLDGNRVRIQENGIGSQDVSTLSEDHAVPIDPYAAERSEIVRGPEALRYGSQATGGIVSVENDRVPSMITEKAIKGEVRGSATSVDDGRDGGFKVTAGAGAIAVHADAFNRQAEDYDTPRGLEENSFADSQGGSVGASVVGSNGFIGVAFVRLESLYGIPAEDVRIDLEQDKILSKGEWRIQSGGIEALRFWFGASNYAHDEIGEEGDVGSRFTNREQELRFEAAQQTLRNSLGELNGSLGLQWGHRKTRGQSFEGTSLLEPAETDRIVAFAYEELGLTPALKLLGAGRIEHAVVSGQGLLDFSDPANLVRFEGERQFTPYSLSAGLAYEVSPGTILRLTGLYAERAPEAEELYSQGLHEATGTFEIGNPNLDKEKASTIEVGLSKAAGRFRFDAAMSYTRYDGFITKTLTGVQCGDTIDTCGIEDELDQLLFVQRDARFFGGEVIGQYDVAPVWNGVWGIEAQYDFVRARFGSGENVPRIPPHRLGGGLYYRDVNWFARAHLLHAFDQDRIATNETPTDGYTLFSAELSYTSSRGAGDGLEPGYTIGIKGENLLDDEVRNHASFKKDEVLQPGASVKVFGSIRFD